MTTPSVLAAEVAPFALLALAGSAHCAGMCGGFSALVAARDGAPGSVASSSEGRAGRKRRFLSGQLAYLLGKTTTYVTLGLALSLLALGMTGEASPVAGWAETGLLRRLVAWGTGGALVLLGLRTLGLLPRLRKRESSGVSRALASPARLLARPFAEVRKLGGLSGAFGIGLLTGLLPCGLSWAAILLSLSVHPTSAVLGLTVFGLSTGPALMLAGGLGAVLAARTGRFGRKLAGPVLIALGLIVVWRGGFGLGGDPSAGHGDCCGEPVRSARDSGSPGDPSAFVR